MSNQGETRNHNIQEASMKRFFAGILSIALAAGLLAGCSGTQVHVCPPQEGAQENETPAAPAAEGSVKTGLAVLTSLDGSAGAGAEEPGSASFDVTLAAVTVDDAGVIDSCVIDGVQATVNFDAAGAITTDLTAPIQTKNELGENYGMKAYGGAAYEWNEQAAALAQYAVGKTVDQLKNGAVDETGHAADADLASVATIYLGGYVAAIEAAVEGAQHLGAQAGDRLALTTTASLGSSKNASAEEEGLAQFDVNVAVTTFDGDTITSCLLDGVQPAVKFDAAGAVTSDLTAPVQTKNQLGENYGMKAYGGAIAEWNEQAATFAAYVTGKTAEEVSGIAVGERTQPIDADLASSVTIAIGGFQELIAKAAQ